MILRLFIFTIIFLTNTFAFAGNIGVSQTGGMNIGVSQTDPAAGGATTQFPIELIGSYIGVKMGR